MIDKEKLIQITKKAQKMKIEEEEKKEREEKEKIEIRARKEADKWIEKIPELMEEEAKKGNNCITIGRFCRGRSLVVDYEVLMFTYLTRWALQNGFFVKTKKRSYDEEAIDEELLCIYWIDPSIKENY